MTKCLSCGHFRHDLELNCPKCGSFYSTIVDDFDGEPLKHDESSLLAKLKVHLTTPKQRLFSILTVIFLLIAVLFL
jgi:hypothetical protein